MIVGLRSGRRVFARGDRASRLPKQFFHFAFMDDLVLAGREVAQRERANLRADQSFHGIANVLKHQSNLPLEPLAQNDLVEMGAKAVDGIKAAHLAFDEHAVAELVGVGFEIELAIETDFVNLRQLKTRVRHLLRELAVVGKQEQAFAVHVETTHVENPGPVAREKIEDGLGATFFNGAAKITAGLVEHGRERTLGMHFLARDGNAVVGTNSRGEFGNALTVEEHLPGKDEFLTGAAGAMPRPGQKLIQSHVGKAAPWEPLDDRMLFRGAGLGQIQDAAAFFELAALLEKIHAFETLEDVALGGDGTRTT